MDAQAKKKALFRAKLNAKKQDKRIDSPLVRYNEHDQPVCRVCNVALKSESLWPAHQASRKHNEAINNLKASAAAVTPTNGAKPEPVKESANPKAESEQGLSNNKLGTSNGLPQHRPTSNLPSDFFDKNDTKRQNNERQGVIPVVRASKVQTLAKDEVGPVIGIQSSNGKVQKSQTATVSETVQSKGALPEGFFDDKDADMLARGITPVKPDVKDEYKEFEKLIQEDLQEVDNRLEEEEVDAAEMREEAESVEQRTVKERLELLKRKRIEKKRIVHKDARTATSGEGNQVSVKESARESSSDDDESDDDLMVDWRAKHF